MSDPFFLSPQRGKSTDLISALNSHIKQNNFWPQSFCYMPNGASEIVEQLQRENRRHPQNVLFLSNLLTHIWQNCKSISISKKQTDSFSFQSLFRSESFETDNQWCLNLFAKMLFVYISKKLILWMKIFSNVDQDLIL